MESVINHFVLLNPPGIFEGILFTLLLLLVLYGSYRSTINLPSIKKKAVIISLHILSFLLLIFILFNPAYRIADYKEDKKNLSVLVDNSWSMSLPGNENEKTRDQNVKSYIERNNKFFSELEKDYYVDYYLFSQKLEDASLKSINNYQPRGSATNIGDVLEYLGEKNKNNKLDTAILISDGSDKDLSQNSIHDQLNDISFPINTINPGIENDIYDVWIDDIESNEVTFLRYPFSIDVQIKSNIADNFKIPVSIYEEDKLIGIKEASLDKESKQANVRFDINPLSLGRKIYTVSIPVISEELITENNQKSFFTDVIINKIRVLHVAGRPSWDVKFLRKTLKRNPNIDLVSFFILRDPSDLVFASERELSLIPFPVNEIFSSELDTFDVVIFQDFYFQPYGIFGFHLNNLKDYVSRNGGAFLMIGGSNSFNSGNYGRTSISDILPVELDYTPKTLSETISSQIFHPELTEIGKSHPIMRIIPNKNENERHWSQMPELEGLNTVQGLNESAISLLTTANGDPVLAVENINSGKVAAFMSDSSWKWNFAQASEGNVSPLYDKFWNRLFLWFVNDPELRNVKISTKKPIYNPGDSATIEVSTLEPENTSNVSRAIITLPNGEQKEIELERSSQNRYTGEFTVQELGIYKVSVIPDGEAEEYKDFNESETIFIVEPPEKEVRGPTANLELLKLIADKSGGEYITTDQNPEELRLDTSKKKSITGYKTKKLWDNPFIFLLIIGMLSTEWLLRRRWGLK